MLLKDAWAPYIFRRLPAGVHVSNMDMHEDELPDYDNVSMSSHPDALPARWPVSDTNGVAEAELVEEVVGERVAEAKSEKAESLGRLDPQRYAHLPPWILVGEAYVHGVMDKLDLDSLPQLVGGGISFSPIRVV